MAGDRLAQKPDIKFTNQGKPSSDPSTIQTWSGRWLYSTQKFQNWGTTINDASAILLANLTSDAQSSLLESMFDPDTGNNIGLIRTNIGSSQFSTEPYTLDETPDPSLSNFALSSYDTQYKVPLFQKLSDLGYKVSLNPVLWSPPNWMKTTGLENLGNVIPTTENLQSLTNYLLKYVDAIAEYINVFAVSPQNTPVSHENGYPNVEWGLQNYAVWIVTYISQVFMKNYPEIKIITSEERETPTMYVENLVGLVEDSVNRNSDLDISNLAFYGIHQGFRADAPFFWWETPQLTSQVTKPAFTDVMLEMGAKEKNNDFLGNWSLGEKYGRGIIESMNGNSSLWIDGNMLLNERGGPSWVGKYAASTIMTDDYDNNVFYKNPQFYIIGQFSRFIEPGAKIHRHKQKASGGQHAGSISWMVADNEDNRVAVFSNRYNETLAVNYFDYDSGQEAALELEAESFTTIYYERNF